MSCRNENSFGPAVEGCRGDFDFTAFFEQVVFTLLPACAFVPLSAASIFSLLKRPAVVQAALFSHFKLAITCVNAILRLVVLVLGSHGAYSAISNRQISVTASAVDFIAALFLIAISRLSHSRSVRPSPLVSFYLLTTLLLDVATVRTAWLLPPLQVQRSYSTILTSATAVKAVIFVAESWEKKNWLLIDRKQLSPEETSGLPSLGVFAWLYQLFMNGFRGVLSLDSLYPLDRAMSTELMAVKFQNTLNKHPLSRKKHALLWVLCRALYKELMFPIAPRLVFLASGFCQPYLIDTLLDFLGRNQEERRKSHSYGLILATMLTYSTIAISAALYWYLQERFVLRVRGCLVLAIYRKSTELESSASGDTGVLTLMSTDVERIAVGILSLHEFWANLVQVGIACWLLQGKLGSAFVAPVLIVLVCTLSTIWAGKLVAPSQRAWMQAIQTRVGVISDAISQMKLIKMSGMVKPVQNYIQDLREKDLALGGRWRLLIAFTSSISQVPMEISPVITFAFTSKHLDARTIFVSLAYTSLLASPLTVLLQKIPQLVSALACLGRVQDFLEREARIDPRSLDAPPENTKTSSTPLNAAEMLLGDIPMRKLRSNPIPQMSLTISNANFGWTKGKYTLRNVNIGIPSGRLTVVTGEVGSGKSTLCRAMLGEVPVADGSLHILQDTAIGYCDQQPFLSNASIRDNIVACNEYDEGRYQKVLRATMLHVDLLALALGDQTIVGSGGISLSGGQRQRLSIARALYNFGSDILIFDDVLSGLDAITEEWVFRHVFGPQGLATQNNRTVILCTHNMRHVSSAHHLLKITSGGKVTEQRSDNVRITGVDDPELPSETVGPIPLTTAIPAGSKDGPGQNTSPDRARQMGDVTVYKHYIKTISILPWTIFLVSGCCFGFLANYPRVWLSKWTEDLSQPDGPHHPQSYYMGIYALLQVSCWISSIVTTLTVLTAIIRQSGSALHEAALATVINASLTLFTKTDLGVIVNHFSQDINMIDSQLPISLINIILDLTNIIGMGAVLASSSPWLTLSYPGLIGILWVVQHFYLRTSRQLRLLDLEAKSPLYSHFLDTAKGIATIRAFGWVQQNIERNAVLLDRSQRTTYLLAMIQRWLHLALSLIVMITATIMVALMTQLGTGAAISGASLVTLMTLSQSLIDVVRFYTSFETSIGAVSRLRTFSETTKSEARSGVSIPPLETWPHTGQITVTNVWASYTNETSAYCLRGLNAQILPGEKVALCGRTGSGKSSFILMLLGLLEPIDENEHATRLSIDGESLSSVERQCMRERLITIPQEPVFLPSGSTIAQNLDPLDMASEDQRERVLKDVGLWYIVEDLGGDLQAVFQASSLSHGQRQLLSLARAVLKRRVTRRSVLLLDEFTSSVDAETERDMMKIIFEEFRDCTVIMVSHRLDVVVEMFDRVLVMEKGQLVESGDPRTLQQVPGGWFARLLESSKKSND
ncbi:hypothetical protein NLG97_g1819 [Lecanicillium saksenae]|uniref:Uncharacterized protein n=1 Tax=Lecanicillium saksenae TaxID=468837 RepID=A0ACC1R4J3_9HYPO|nr:hypothetical protein NLG97_g1819 [Lecanicillium saksenae]